MSTITNLNVNLLANTSNFDPKIKKSGSVFGGFSDMLGGLPGPSQIAKGAIAGVTAVATPAAAGVALLAASVTDLSTEIVEFERFGLSAEKSLGQFKAMALASKLEVEDFTDVAKDLSVRIGEANLDGEGETFDLFKRIGLDVKSLAGLSPEKQLEAYANAISKVDNATERLTVTDILLSDAGTKALKVLEQGTAGFEAAAKQANDFGLNVSAVDSSQLLIAQESINKISLLTEGLWTQFAAQGAPILTAITEMFIEGTEQAGGMASVVETGFGILNAGIGFALDGWNVFMAAWHAGQALMTVVIAHTLDKIALVEQALVAIGGKSFDFGVQDLATAAWQTAEELGKQSLQEFGDGVDGVASRDFENRIAEIKQRAIDDAAKKTKALESAPIEPVKIEEPKPVKFDTSILDGLAAVGSSIFNTVGSLFEGNEDPQQDVGFAAGLARFSAEAQSVVNQLAQPAPPKPAAARSLGEETGVKDQLKRNADENNTLLEQIVSSTQDVASALTGQGGVIVGIDG